MKRNVLVCVLVLAFLAVGTSAFGRGESCAFPIELGKDYHAQITGAGTYWYVANTFDLPLSVYFTPQNESDPAPEIQMDFTCTPGVYKDSILCSLFCPQSGGIEFDMPHTPKLSEDVKDGKKIYYLSMGKTYRDLLLKMGIDYNVEVYVKVTYKASGAIAMAPDDMFSNCMDGYKFMHLGDTVHVAANDKDRHVIVPYVQWQSDSIRYIWEGEEPVKLAVASVCEFDPMDGADPNVLHRTTLHKGDTLKVASARLSYYVNFVDNAAGMFYAKFYSAAPGIMKVERVPMAPPEGGATLLKYDYAAKINANDTLALYAIPATWDTATIFTAPTNYSVRMYVGLTPEFTPITAVDSFQFSRAESAHTLGLLTSEMKALAQKATSNYLYVRFRCAALTSVTPAIWKHSDCLPKCGLITTDSVTISVKRQGYGAAYYRFYFADWVGGDMTFNWKSATQRCKTYIGKNCSFPADDTNADVFGYKNIAKSGLWTIPAEIVAEWKDNVDEDGYLYIRFVTDDDNEMVISTTAPKEKDPEIVPVSEIQLNATSSVLDAEHKTVYITATVLPSNATDPSLTWTITEGEDLVTWKPSTFSVTCKESVTSGTVTVKAAANDGSGVFNTVTLTIDNPTTDMQSVDKTADYSRIVLHNGIMCVELNRAGVTTLYDMTGRKIQINNNN